ncbi:hypothetical protein [Phocaeicola sp.]|uniref:hypothetical protein n=1 Tax=Phocaeicola sp. TaxID=2773926 RepID=UPI0023C86D5C|nr:hypothetical protein [Phocaeicola sp.]MDE5678168.1 hypothetical protein [Phocaeicola sp.]
MKRWTTLLMMVCMLGVTVPAMATMSISKMRQNTRFLTDRMAYELKLSPRQYNDVYEVNYDFINNVRYLMDDVVRGYDYALERYYDFLDVRNDDLRWILSGAQYRRFMGAEHFYRPIYAHENKWNFRIYLVYNNVNFFYYGKPHHYTTYCGGHYRTHFNNVSYYKTHCRDHYRHDVYNGHFRIRHDKMTYDTHRRRDFNVAVRSFSKDQRRPSAPQARPDRPKRDYNNKPDGRPSRREQNSQIDKKRRENKRTAPSGSNVKREDSKKEKNSNRSRERSGSNSNERCATRVRTV